MNEEETERQKEIEYRKFKELQSAKEQSKRLIDLVSRGILEESEFQESSEKIKKKIKRLEKEIEDTNNTSKSWREGMRKTIRILFNGKKEFDEGDIYAKYYNNYRRKTIN